MLTVALQITWEFGSGMGYEQRHIYKQDQELGSY